MPSLSLFPHGQSQEKSKAKPASKETERGGTDPGPVPRQGCPIHHRPWWQRPPSFLAELGDTQASCCVHCPPKPSGPFSGHLRSQPRGFNNISGVTEPGVVVRLTDPVPSSLSSNTAPPRGKHLLGTTELPNRSQQTERQCHTDMHRSLRQGHRAWTVPRDTPRSPRLCHETQTGGVTHTTWSHAAVS